MNLSTKTNYLFDVNNVREEVYSILEKYNYPKQIGLTHTPGIVDEHEKIFQSTGHLYDPIARKLKFRETDFTEFNSSYKKSVLYDIYRTLGNIGRFRINVMDGPSCYSIHADMTCRYHFAIDTNENCFMYFPEYEKQFRIPNDGYFYILDTRHKHTFINGSKERRIHLVIDDLSTIDNTRIKGL
jgi:hypothetical protein